MNTTCSHAAAFAPTRWTMVLNAADPTSTVAFAALSALCETYRRPLYAFIRRRGYSPADAEDLIQGFFCRIIDKNYLRAVNPAKGKFRTFLLTALSNFLRNEWAHAHRQKRGGYKSLLSLDAVDDEGRYLAEPRDGLTPEKLFERQWAETILERVMSRLGQESAHPPEVFAALKPFLTRDEESSAYQQLGQRFKMSPVALRVAVHRLRESWRIILRDEVLQTLAPGENVDEEIRYLITALMQPGRM